MTDEANRSDDMKNSPNTLETVSFALREAADYRGKDHLSLTESVTLANVALAAHRQALSDVGWTEAPKVKLTVEQWDSLYDIIDTQGTDALIECLQTFGLPIELPDR